VVETDLAGQFTPLLHSAGLELYDLEQSSGAIRVTVTRPGGVDLDALARANAALSAWLDEHDPMPGRYTLEVSSPGLERRLRTQAHFESAVGESVTLRITPQGAPAERVTGTLVAAGDDGVTLSTDAGPRTARYDQIERARTVFSWGSSPKPSPSKRSKARSGATSEKEG
jgi:ribosome maturation factor RimP